MTDFVPAIGFPLGPYHEWFAWRPVQTYDRGYVWMRYVWRRRIQKHDYLDGPDMRWWQYKFRS
jgi:hypothetical protein